VGAALSFDRQGGGLPGTGLIVVFSNTKIHAEELDLLSLHFHETLLHSAIFCERKRAISLQNRNGTITA
jgi:hypothetical protein